MQHIRLFHVSEEAGIAVFYPRPSPSIFEGLTENVVFAITEKLLHNYLLPRACPRVCYYREANTTENDMDDFFKYTTARYIIAVEKGWLEKINTTTLYCYELPVETFTLLDEGAGYYTSTQPVVPINVRPVTNVLAELLSCDIELRFVPSLWPLADAVKGSTLQFSLIRMRNATPREAKEK